MAIEITMPQLSDTMNEGKILNWRKQEGDTVSRGDALAEVATDKADLEIESFHEGTLVKILAPTGTTVKVGSIIALIGEKGEKVSVPQQETKPQAAPQPAAQPAPQQQQPQQAAPQPAAQPAAQPVTPQSASSQPAAAPTYSNGSATPAAQPAEGERVKISPLARNLAASHGVDYSGLQGTGDGGRIVRRDIEGAIGASAQQPSAQQPAAAPQQARPSAPVQAPARPPVAAHTGKATEPLTKMRQTIAARMVEATTTIPHFYATSKVSVAALTKLKNSLKPLPQYEGLTYNHLIIRAAALALRAVPRINSSYQEGNLVQPQAVNIGIVTAVQDGLLIPVVKNADQLPLSDIVAEARGMVNRARSGRPKPDDLVGGTFSISNMGMFDVESFTAIISPGQGAILAVSPIQEEPVVADGQVTAGSVMRITLSVDHRIIDGVVAGEFLTELKRLLQDPVLLLA